MTWTLRLVCLLGMVGTGLHSSSAQDVNGSDRDATLADVEIMRRVLVRKVSERSAEVSGSVAVGYWNHVLRAAPDAETDGSALKYFGNLARSDSDYSARADYLPGFGALFSMDVPVRTTWEEDRKEAKEEAPAEEPSLWEEVEKEVHASKSGLLNRANLLLSSDLTLRNRFATESPSGHRVISKDALNELEETLVQVLARYGHELNLPANEKIAVSIHVAPAPGFQAPGAGADLDLRTNLFAASAALSGKVEGPTRLTVQVRASDVTDLKSGRMRLEDFVNKAQIDRF